MGRDMSLTARPDAMWLKVELTDRRVLNAAYRTLAEAWQEDRERAIAAMDELVKGLSRTEGGWDEAVYDLQSNLQLEDADTVELDMSESLRLADELTAAAACTSEARREAEVIASTVVAFPKQHGEAA
jgi:uncharacterized protein YeaO (DUF488 family)